MPRLLMPIGQALHGEPEQRGGAAKEKYATRLLCPADAIGPPRLNQRRKRNDDRPALVFVRVLDVEGGLTQQTFAFVCVKRDAHTPTHPTRNHTRGGVEVRQAGLTRGGHKLIERRRKSGALFSSRVELLFEQAFENLLGVHHPLSSSGAFPSLPHSTPAWSE